MHMRSRVRHRNEHVHWRMPWNQRRGAPIACLVTERMLINAFPTTCVCGTEITPLVEDLLRVVAVFRQDIPEAAPAANNVLRAFEALRR